MLGGDCLKSRGCMEAVLRPSDGDSGPEGYTVDLTSKGIAELPKFNVSDLNKTVFLKLSKNKLTALPTDFIAALSCTTLINLSFNELHDLQAPFGELKTLRTLYLDNNRFRTIPQELCK